MKQLGIRELQLNPTKALSELPVELIKYGKVFAVVFPPKDIAKVQVLGVSTTKPKEEKKVEKSKKAKIEGIGEVNLSGKFDMKDMCPCGSYWRSCKVHMFSRGKF